MYCDRKLGNKTFRRPLFEENLLDFFLWADLAVLVLLLCCHRRKSRLNTCKCCNKVNLRVYNYPSLILMPRMAEINYYGMKDFCY